MSDVYEFRTLLEGINVSRETFDRLKLYQKILTKWNLKINLVGKSTINDSWERHFMDSVQLWRMAPEFSRWADLGSGAGFPGMVIAIIAAELMPEAEIHLVESDARKCAFLRNVSRETNVRVFIHNCRIADLEAKTFDVISARALAPVDKLLGYAEEILSKNGRCLFLKGKGCDTEIRTAQQNWQFSMVKIPSRVQEDSAVLRIEGIERV